MVPSTRHTRPWTIVMASRTSGTNSSRTLFTRGTRIVTIRETVGGEIPRRSPKNSCVPLCRRYMQAISTALYSPHAFGRPTFLFHGSFRTPLTRATSSCICDTIKPVVR